MAALTTALLALGLGLAGGTALSAATRRSGDDNTDPTKANVGGQTPLVAPAPPPSLANTAADAARSASNAASRQRNRALAAGTLLTPKTSGAPGASLQPKTLLGY